MSNQVKYIDVHGHINFLEYNSDRDIVIKRAQQLGVGMFIVGTDVVSSQKAVELAQKNEHVWAVVGIHPTDSKSISSEDFSIIQELAKDIKVVAIGECGLDYFHSQPDDIKKQREIFIQHIELANTVQKPLMLHVRNAKQEYGGIEKNHNAYQEAITLLKEKARVRANFHFFAGSLKDAQDIVAMNNTVSFTGVISFARNYDEIIQNIPLVTMLSETDCPFVTPIPYRGKRNEPSYVIEVVNKIAEIRNENIDIVGEQILKNAKSFFNIS